MAKDESDRRGWANSGKSPDARAQPNPEVSDKAKRRRFTAKYKLEILRKVDLCEKRGEVGALLRREGLYSSSIGAWRRARESGELAALTPKIRGRKTKAKDHRDKKINDMERAIRRLEQKLAKAETIIDIQKKVSSLLGIPLKNLDDQGND